MPNLLPGSRASETEWMPKLQSYFWPLQRRSRLLLYLLDHRDDPGGLLGRVAMPVDAPAPLVHLLQHVDDLVEGGGEILHAESSSIESINSRHFDHCG